MIPKSLSVANFFKPSKKSYVIWMTLLGLRSAAQKPRQAILIQAISASLVHSILIFKSNYLLQALGPSAGTSVLTCLFILGFWLGIRWLELASLLFSNSRKTAWEGLSSPRIVSESMGFRLWLLSPIFGIFAVFYLLIKSKPTRLPEGARRFALEIIRGRKDKAMGMLTGAVILAVFGLAVGTSAFTLMAPALSENKKTQQTLEHDDTSLIARHFLAASSVMFSYISNLFLEVKDSLQLKEGVLAKVRTLPDIGSTNANTQTVQARREALRKIVRDDLLVEKELANDSVTTRILRMAIITAISVPETKQISFLENQTEATLSRIELAADFLDAIQTLKRTPINDTQAITPAMAGYQSVMGSFEGILVYLVNRNINAKFQSTLLETMGPAEAKFQKQLAELEALQLTEDQRVRLARLAGQHRQENRVISSVR